LFLTGRYITARKSDVLRLQLIPTFFVFVMLLVLIGSAYHTAQEAVREELTRISDRKQLDVENKLTQRLEAYDNFLRAGSGLFESSDSVPRESWRQFVESFDLQNRYGGALGAGYVSIIQPDDLEAFEQSVRSEGFPAFRVRPSGSRDVYTVITYIEPFDETNQRAFGYDMYSEPVRRTAMDQARASGSTAMTAPISLQQDELDPNVKSVLMYNPVHDVADLPPDPSPEEYAASTIGYVYAPFRAQELIERLFVPEDHFGFGIIDVTDDSGVFLFEMGEMHGDNRLVTTSELDLYGRRWAITYSTGPELIPDFISNRPVSVLTGGILFASAISFTVFLLLQRRSRQLAEKQKRRLDKARDDLLSMASHQLRTPATGVKQYVGMVLEGFTGDVDESARLVLEKAYQNNERQLHIINEFLYLAKADAGRLVLDSKEFNLAQLVRDVVEVAAESIEERGHNLKIQSPKTVMVYADIHTSRMIIENLLSNAVKYTPDNGKIRIRIDKDSRCARVHFIDNGVGIKESHRDRLFEQFTRIPNSLTKQTSGSGIGLYLAQLLARLNDGEVFYEPNRRKGSTFTVTFPVNKNVKNLTDKKSDNS
jgi:signal transduction histidine kinase